MIFRLKKGGKGLGGTISMGVRGAALAARKMRWNDL